MAYPRTERDLVAYFYKLVELMWLGQWRISLEVGLVEEEDDGGRPVAQTQLVADQHDAYIYVSEQWSDWDGEDLRLILVHELVHCHLSRLQYAHGTVKSILGREGWSVYDAQIDRVIEQTADEIATAWADRLPLP